MAKRRIYVGVISVSRPSNELLARRQFRAWAKALRDGSPLENREKLIAYCSKLAEYPGLLTALDGNEFKYSDERESFWRAWHCLLKERAGVKASLARDNVGELWGKSSETIEDDLTNHRDAAESRLQIDIDSLRLSGEYEDDGRNARPTESEALKYLNSIAASEIRDRFKQSKLERKKSRVGRKKPNRKTPTK